VVVAGFANGIVAGVDANNGLVMWEERVAVPQGRYDIDRIIDIDGDPILAGSTVFVSSYQGNLMGLDLMTGRIVWGMAGSSYNSLALGLGNIYWVNNFSHLFAIQNNTERTVWENRDLRLRRITSPTTINNYVAVADFEGYLHMISQIDGRIVSRVRVDSDGVRANIVADGNVLYVYGNSGRLVATETALTTLRGLRAASTFRITESYETRTGPCRPPERGQINIVQSAHPRRDALVADFPGLTRDRQYGEGITDCP